MIIERADLFFRDALARWLMLVLQGDEKQNGLYRAILSCQDWDSTNRAKGEILAYESVLRKMDDIVRQMNTEEEPRAPVPSPFRMN